MLRVRKCILPVFIFYDYFMQNQVLLCLLFWVHDLHYYIHLQTIFIFDLLIL